MPVDMTPESLVELLQIVRDGGSTALLVLAVLGGMKGWYVWRWQYDAQTAASAKLVEQLTKERDEWKAVALRGLSVAERVTG